LKKYLSKVGEELSISFVELEEIRCYPAGKRFIILYRVVENSVEFYRRFEASF